jgi:hypothetical protein
MQAGCQASSGGRAHGSGRHPASPQAGPARPIARPLAHYGAWWTCGSANPSPVYYLTGLWASDIRQASKNPHFPRFQLGPRRRQVHRHGRHEAARDRPAIARCHRSVDRADPARCPQARRCGLPPREWGDRFPWGLARRNWRAAGGARLGREAVMMIRARQVG